MRSKWNIEGVQCARSLPYSQLSAAGLTTATAGRGGLDKEEGHMGRNNLPIPSLPALRDEWILISESLGGRSVRTVESLVWYANYIRDS